MADDADVRQRLQLAIERSVNQVWSPWYVRGSVPEAARDVFADIALRRWKSRHRRSVGRRDPVRDMANGWCESPIVHPPGSMPIDAREKKDYYELAVVLEGILRKG